MLLLLTKTFKFIKIIWIIFGNWNKFEIKYKY